MKWRRPKPANVNLMSEYIQGVHEEAEKTRAMMSEIQNCDHIIVETKSTGRHYFGAKAWTEYQLHVMHVTEGPNVMSFLLHDVLCVRTVKAGITMNYIRQ